MGTAFSPIFPTLPTYTHCHQEYSAKASGGKLPDVTPAAEKELSDELSRLKRIYGEGDLSKLPSFEFKDVDIGGH